MIHITGERARLADERPDHVPVVDAAEIAADQPLARELHFVRKPDLDAILEDPHSNPLAHQPRRHRVRAVLDPHRTPLADPDLLLDVFGQLRDVELAHRREVFVDASAAIPVGLACDLIDQRLPRLDALEVAVASHEQRLLEPALERSIG